MNSNIVIETKIELIGRLCVINNHSASIGVLTGKVEKHYMSEIYSSQRKIRSLYDLYEVYAIINKAQKILLLSIHDIKFID